MSIADDLLIASMRLLPKNGLSRSVGALARTRLPRRVLRAVLERFVRHFGVDLSEAERPLEEYDCVDDFFTRRLKEGARPIDDEPEAVVSPCDGLVMSVGPLSYKHVLQAKGRRYSLARFLEDTDLTDAFADGHEVTIYLHPRDYHRVHAPLGGRVTGYRHVPGELFPVSQAAVDRVDDLFAVNERLITVLDTAAGKVAVAMVGALNVGHITVSYDSMRTNLGGKEIVRHNYSEPSTLERGGELGTFHFGSTVVLIFQSGRVELDGVKVGERVRMGQRIGTRRAIGGKLRVIQGRP